MSAKIGDTVNVWKFVFDRSYQTSGVVEETQSNHGENLVKVNGDWWVDENSMTNKIEIIQSAAAEEKLPKWAVGWCHYCGMPAKNFNFFDVPACEQCGG